jgi:hypothetical protein
MGNNKPSQQALRASRNKTYRERMKAYRQRIPGEMHTIFSFCVSNQISQSKYFQLKRQGLGPREIELDGRIIITPEAEQDWRREREAETMARRARSA